MNNWKGKNDTNYPSLHSGFSPDDDDDFVKHHLLQHKDRIEEQDQYLKDIGEGVERIGKISLEIHKELDGQNKMLGILEDDYDEVIHSMNLVTKKTNELIKKSGGKRNFGIIACLSVILVVLVILVLYT